MSDTQKTRLQDRVETMVRALNAANDVKRLERELAEAQERIKFLTNAYGEAHEEICQVAGKALGYPWIKDDQKNFHGATEADGVCVGEHVAETIVEELARKYTEAQDRIKRLEESGDRVAAAWDKEWLNQADIEAIIDDWRKAKESKP